MNWIQRVVAVVFVLSAGVVGLATPSVATVAPERTTPVAVELTAAAQSSSGWNNWNCRPSAAHPRPVVLLHGLGGQSVTNWAYHAPKLAAAGYCVYSTTFGAGLLGNLVGGLGPMRDSAQQVSAFVEQVKASTGTAEVDLVGHSAGTTVAAYYLKHLGGAANVANFVGFGSNFAGTSLSGLGTLASLAMPFLPNVTEFVRSQCAACIEFLPPNDFLSELNSGGTVVVPGVNYTSIVSRYDTIVTPYTSGNVSGPNATTHVLQNVCRFDFSGHLGMAISPNVTTLIKRALDPVEAAKPMRCGLAISPGI